MELLLPVLLLGLVIWMFTRQRKAQRDQANLRSSLQPGQRIMTTAGMFGTVLSVDGDRMKVEIAPGVVVELLVAAMARAVPADVADDASALGAPMHDDLGPDETAAVPDYAPELDDHLGTGSSPQIDLTKGESASATSDGRTSLDKGDQEPRPGT